jgi:hypothetical protein
MRMLTASTRVDKLFHRLVSVEVDGTKSAGD